jgi:hypothetical protein
MHEAIREKVDVIAVFTRSFGGATPRRIRWQGRDYDVKEVGMHHPVRDGRTMHHVFSVVAGALFFRLDFDTETLQWTVEEISDGLAD